MRLPLVLLAAATLISRLPFVASQPYGWDSYNYCLALERFSPLEDMAHFPGYLNYVMVAKAFLWLVGDAHAALVAWSVLASVLLAAAAYGFAFTTGADWANIARGDRPFFATAATTLLLCNPLVWMYGEVALGYINGALAGVLGVWTIGAAERGKWSWLWPAAFIGWLTGFRLEAGALALLWLYRAHAKRVPWKTLLLAPAAFLGGVLLWLLPTVLAAGSFSAYALRGWDLLSGSAVHYVAEEGSVITSALRHVLRAAGLLIVLAGGGLIVLIRPREVLRQVRNLPRSFIGITACWVLPVVIPLGLLFLLPGYLLIVAPAMALLIAALLVRIGRSPAARSTMLAVAIALSIAYFAFPYASLSMRSPPFTAGRIAENDRRMTTLQAAFAREIDDGAAATIFYDELYGWRAAMRDFPHVPAYQVNELPRGRIIACGIAKREFDLPPADGRDVIALPDTAYKIIVVPRGNLNQFRADFGGFAIADTIKTEFGTIYTAVRI